MLKFKKEAAIDAFLVGGGSGGCSGWYKTSSNYGAGGGGGGGFTKTLLNIIPRANLEYEIVIGGGGSGGKSRTSPGIEVISPTNGGDTVAFGATAGGGKVSTAITPGSSLSSAMWQYLICGGSGGSGGGQSVGREITSPYNVAGAGGSDGSDGGTANPQPNATRYPIGTGQGTTTREFGEAAGKLYAGGGGAGNILGTPTSGGDGGGGNGGSKMTATPNTGGGGGGANEGSVSTGGDGGSGIVCIRLHKKKEGLQFNYTGQYNERLDDRVVELYTGGVFTVPKDVLVDLFLVGGGGAGGRGNSAAGSNVWPGGGGGGGYTKTVNSFSLHAGTKYTVVIGNGGSTHGADGESTSFGVNSVLGGKGGYESTDVNNPHAGSGGAGGSGGGGAVNGHNSGSSVIGSGGSDGSDGSTGYPVATVYGIGGKGQGTTTREFGEPTGKLYAGGGGGGRHSTSNNNQSPGGEGGGGTGSWSGSTSTVWAAGTPGEPRTGGGGGGGVMHQTTTGYGWQDSSAAGGSGIVCVRLHKEEKLDFTYGGDYTVREDGVVELKSSSAITFPKGQKIDIFCVGGGGGGGWNPQYSDDPSSSISYGGGGGGRTTTRLNQAVSGGYQITIGSGGLHGIDGGATSFGNLCTAAGGDAAPSTR